MTVLTERTLLPAMTITRRGAADDLFELARPFGDVGLIVHGSSLVRSGALAKLQACQPDDVTVQYHLHDGGEPTVQHLEALVRLAERQGGVRWVAAIGGGSVMDLAKSAAALIGAPAPVMDYFNGAASFVSGVPFLAVPTTAGTGSEATPAAVFLNDETHVKAAIIHPGQMARVVVLDAELLASCPAHIVASAGMDAFTQAIEAYVSTVESSLIDAIAVEAIGVIAGALPVCVKDPAAPEMQDLLVGSYLAGVSLSNARLGLVHGLAHPLGAYAHAAHGLVCATLLGPVLAYNKPAMEEKYRTIADAIQRDPIELVADWIDAFALHSPFRKEHFADIDGILAYTMNAGVTKSNPRLVAADDVKTILDNLPLADAQ
jgi:alcohol dehydrogenase class IV